jgi:hypothetical protein
MRFSAIETARAYPEVVVQNCAYEELGVHMSICSCIHEMALQHPCLAVLRERQSASTNLGEEFHTKISDTIVAEVTILLP